MLLHTVYYKMDESTVRAIISLYEAVDLVEDKHCIPGTDSESEISEDDDPGFIDYD